MVDFDAVYAKLNNDQVDEAFDMLPDRIRVKDASKLVHIRVQHFYGCFKPSQELRPKGVTPSIVRSIFDAKGGIDAWKGRHVYGTRLSAGKQKSKEDRAKMKELQEASRDVEEMKTARDQAIGAFEALKSHVTKDDDNNPLRGLCKVCLDNEINVKLSPCNHACICDECEKSLSRKTCPICKQRYLAFDIFYMS